MKSVDVSSEEIKNVQAAKPKWHKTVAQKKCEKLRLKMACSSAGFVIMREIL